MPHAQQHKNKDKSTTFRWKEKMPSFIVGILAGIVFMIISGQSALKLLEDGLPSSNEYQPKRSFHSNDSERKDSKGKRNEVKHAKRRAAFDAMNPTPRERKRTKFNEGKRNHSRPIGNIDIGETIIDSNTTPTPVLEYASSEKIFALKAALHGDDKNPSKEKYLVIHVGPQKTASTFIQSRCRKFANTTLKEDKYIYIGKGTKYEHGKSFYNFFKDFNCRGAVQDARVGGVKTLPQCMDVFVEHLKLAQDNNILMSSEDLRISLLEKKPEYLAALKEISSMYGYHILFVVVYRRLFEWLPSAHMEKNTGAKSNGNFANWPNEGGRRVTSFFPTALKSEYLNTTHGTHLWFKWTPTYLRSLPEFIETRTLNLYADHDTAVKFFCHMVPNAQRTCQLVRESEKQGIREGKANPSTPLGYDHLAISAVDAGLVDATKYTRREVQKAIKKYQENKLKRTGHDFPRMCPQREHLELLLEASLRWEKEIMPEMTDSEQEHRGSFWRAVETNKYCFMDANATLAMEEWQQFFRQRIWEKRRRVGSVLQS